MRTTFHLIFLTSTVIGLTGCHTSTISLSSAPSGNGVTANPDCLLLSNSDAGSDGKVAVKWKAPASEQWLIHFLGNTPCGSDHVIQNGMGTATCIVDVNKMDTFYKYNAFVGAGHVDPGIAHNTGDLKRACPPPSTPRIVQAQSKFFCLDLSTGKPLPCNNGEPPQTPDASDPLHAAPGDDIFWHATSSWTIKMDPGACQQTEISSTHSYCSVTGTVGSTYTYSVTINGATTGPYKLQVNGRQ